jgi:TerC family integral membrane protein
MIDLLLQPWVAFAGLVIALFTIDLLFGHRGGDLRAATLWSAVWVGAGLAFGLYLWAMQGGETAATYYAAYLLEKSLSIDNIFVFVLIFSQLRIPAHQQHRVLLLGIVGALVMRALMIWGGVYLLQRFHWVIYPFAALLLIAAVRLLFGESTERRIVEESCAACTTWVAKIIPVTPMAEGQHFLVRHGGRLMATPMFVALILIETTDLIFALDSIPAVLAITRDPYIVYTSNIFALLGLRALYFVLADVVQRFHYLRPGLAAILCFVAAKMLLADVVDISVAMSLTVIVGIVLVAVAASWAFPRAEQAREPSDIGR